MRRLLPLFVFVAIACGPAKRVDPCSLSAMGAADQPVLLVLVGEPVELELILPPAVFCPGGNPLATSVVTEVLDAQNRPVAHTHSEPKSSNTAGYSTLISFTPTIAGVHYLTARFEPALGITQRQLQVVLDRSSETPWLRTTLGAVCDDVLPLREAVLCRRGSQVTLVRDGGVELSETATSIASRGATGWLWTDTHLTRLFDGDAGLERADLSLTNTSAVYGVTEDRWVHPTSAGFREVFAADGGLLERQRSVSTFDLTGPNVVLSGETIGWASSTSLCALAGDASVRCVDSPLQPNASEGSSMWLRGAESGATAIARFDTRGTPPTVVFVPAPPGALQEARFSRPMFSSSGRLILVRADDLSFEAWRPPGPLARQTVTESFVVFQLQSGETVIYRR